ncbi:ABC transporter ATP-binding protein [Novibacillus thermophilus]|uniref:ABC transporter domain-containing protein n=1 Tax=Novibacillus thermophilus TaxID=1471761 RepID=A0A1U9K4V9_9BACL|nr:ABC transporter ATP-binding protein [Novibacillus thermophilus]AQS55062.1 hypothetical protein B0W44_04010 [Novibacillus thermophilus]
MIHLHHIRKQFGHFTAVDDVTLSIEKGTVYGLLGANGAGKTTLIKIMCGLLDPTSGTGTIFGHDLVRERNRIKQSIGYMSQKFSLYQDLTVSENIAFYARLYGIEKPETRARELSEQFDVYTFKDKVVYSLSSGVRQRVAFACALVHAPKLLFLDEPTSGVDPLARRKVWKWLYRLAADGMSIVVTTHYMDEAEHCDRIALMNAGRIVAEGTLDTLRKGLPVQLHSLEDIFVHVMREDVNR